MTKQHEALKAHVQVLDHPDVSFTASALSAAFEAPPETQLGKRGPETLASLRALATAFTQIAFGYALLHALAHRSVTIATCG